MHVPIEIAQAARGRPRALGADCCVAIGGGSTTGLAKAIALVSDLPILAIPTTYAGSEMTPIWGMTENGVKKTGRDPRVLPKTVLYDPALTVTHAGAALRHQRHQRHRALRRGAVCQGRQSDHLDDRRRGYPRARRGACRWWCEDPENLDARARALRSMAGRHALGRWGWRCITSCATRWAGLSIFRTPKRIP